MNSKVIKFMFAQFIDKFFYKDQAEILESAEYSLDERYEIVEKLGKILKRSGFNDEFMAHFEKLVKKDNNWPKMGKISVCELGAGSGAMLRVIHDWAKKHNIEADLTGVELDAEFAKLSESKLHETGLKARIINADATNLSMFSDSSFDFVYCNNMLHHIRSPEKVAALFKEAERVSRKGWLVMDLERRLLGIPVMYMSLIIGATKMMIIDGVRSVRRAYRRNEIQKLLDSNTLTHSLPKRVCKGYFHLPYWYIFAPKN